jgi:hypothetical protein
MTILYRGQFTSFAADPRAETTALAMAMMRAMEVGE